MAASRALRQIQRPKTAEANKGKCVDTNQPGSSGGKAKSVQVPRGKKS